MTTVEGGPVLSHVQAFVNAAERSTGVDTYKTYNGHDPDRTRALDIWPRTKAEGDAICDFALANWDRYGVWYVIWRQRIYNPDVADHWRNMADRGSPTQNHFDHVHVSFWPTGASTPSQEEDDELQTDERDALLETHALIRDVATGLAEWKRGELPSPRLDDIEKRLAALEGDKK